MPLHGCHCQNMFKMTSGPGMFKMTSGRGSDVGTCLASLAWRGAPMLASDVAAFLLIFAAIAKTVNTLWP